MGTSELNHQKKPLESHVRPLPTAETPATSTLLTYHLMKNQHENSDGDFHHKLQRI